METGDEKYLQEGKKACETAVKAGIKPEVDGKNLGFYIETEQKIEKVRKGQPPNSTLVPSAPSGSPPPPVPPPSVPPVSGKPLSKAEFFEKKFQELRARYPKLPNKNVKDRVEKLWKEELKSR